MDNKYLAPIGLSRARFATEQEYKTFAAAHETALRAIWEWYETRDRSAAEEVFRAALP